MGGEGDGLEQRQHDRFMRPGWAVSSGSGEGRVKHLAGWEQTVGILLSLDSTHRQQEARYFSSSV